MNITTKFDVEDEVYFIGSDGDFYRGEVGGFNINFACTLLHKVRICSWRRSAPSSLWEVDEYGTDEVEIMESELFATEEEMLANGNKILLKKKLHSLEGELRELRRRLGDNRLSWANLERIIREEESAIAKTEQVIEKLKKELEELNERN